MNYLPDPSPQTWKEVEDRAARRVRAEEAFRQISAEVTTALMAEKCCKPFYTPTQKVEPPRIVRVVGLRGNEDEQFRIHRR